MTRTKNRTLLDKARSVPVTRHRIDANPDQLLDLAIAWLRGEVTTRQADEALGTKTGNSKSAMLLALRTAARAGRLGLVQTGGAKP